jgi:hypothetical protein
MKSKRGRKTLGTDTALSCVIGLRLTRPQQMLLDKLIEDERDHHPEARVTPNEFIRNLIVDTASSKGLRLVRDGGRLIVRHDVRGGQEP